MATTTPREILNEKSAEIRRQLSRVTELSESVSLPPEFAAALAAGRPALFKLARPRPLNAEETAALYHAFAVLMQTNLLLQGHAHDLAILTDRMLANFKTVILLSKDISAVARFEVQGGEIDDQPRG